MRHFFKRKRTAGLPAKLVARWLGTLCLSSLAAQAQASVSRAWNSDYINPCQCDASFEESFPQIFANRLPEKDEAQFLKITTNLIQEFTESSEIENSKKYIFWTVYELGAFDVVNALVAAKNAGVNVFVITDGKSVVEKPKETDADTEAEEDESESKTQAVMPWVADRHLLTKEAYKTFVKAKIPVAYSNPEFDPISTPYPPIMHEKTRMFAVKVGSKIVPTFAYVSTHNDTYSETIGDPLTTVKLERLKKGNLSSKELDPRSKGNVQTSFILRHQEILKVVLDNIVDQLNIYKNGKGRIFDIPNKEPQNFELKDGTKVNLSFTYGKRRPTFNPNENIKNFVGELVLEPANSVKADIHLQQFVFSYGGASDNLKSLFEKHNESVKANIWVDGNFAFEPYSQARKMAGMYTILTYRKDMPIEYPWKKQTRENINALAYVNNFDKLHTKNSFIAYQTRHMTRERFKIYTGSLNLSSNGVSNKEMFFVIDTDSPLFIKTMKKQREFLGKEGYLKPIDDSGLFLRIKRTSKKLAGVSFSNEEDAYTAYYDFLKVIDKKARNYIQDTFTLKPYLDLSSINAYKWIDALGEFLNSVGAEKAVEPITLDIQKNLKETEKFFPSVSSVDIMLHLTEQSETLDPKVRQSVLDLFSR